MAVKVTVAASKNGSSSANYVVWYRDTEAIDLGTVLWDGRLNMALGRVAGDSFNVSSVTIQTGQNEPTGGYHDPQISIAFISCD